VASAGGLAGTAVLARKIAAQIAQSSCAPPLSGCHGVSDLVAAEALDAWEAGADPVKSSGWMWPKVSAS